MTQKMKFFDRYWQEAQPASRKLRKTSTIRTCSICKATLHPGDLWRPIQSPAKESICASCDRPFHVILHNFKNMSVLLTQDCKLITITTESRHEYSNFPDLPASLPWSTETAFDWITELAKYTPDKFTLAY